LRHLKKKEKRKIELSFSAKLRANKPPKFLRVLIFPEAIRAAAAALENIKILIFFFHVRETQETERRLK
jgi:hypothetical protein